MSRPYSSPEHRARTLETPVPKGSRLRVGCWYRITEIDPSDPAPSLGLGAVLRCCVDAGPGELDPEWQDSECWFADYQNDDVSGYGTLVTGLVEVHEPTRAAGKLCRQCSECDGNHHWLEAVNDESGEGEYCCKHCEATAGCCDECGGAVFPAGPAVCGTCTADAGDFD